MPNAPNHKRPMSGRRALLVGATGLTGRHLLPRLMADARYSDIHVLSRRPLTIEDDRLHTHVEDDFAHIPSGHTAFNVDDVYCCLGTTIRQAGSRERFRHVDYDFPMMVARTAQAAGAERFVVMSAMGADPQSSSFYLRTKGELERDLEKLSFRQLVIVRPSLLVGRRANRRLLEGVGMWILPKLSWLMQGPLKPYRAIAADVVAGAMHRLAWQGDTGTRVALSDALQVLGDPHREPVDG